MYPVCRVSFSYNSKTKVGNFSIGLPQDYTINGSGTMTSWSKGNPPVTQDMSDYAKAQTGMYTAICGNFTAYQGDIFKNEQIRQTMENSPVSGGQATILEASGGYEISYSFSKTIHPDIAESYEGTSTMTYNTTVHISISRPGPPEYEAIIEPLPSQTNQTVDYKSWIPEGPPIPDKSNKNPQSSTKHQGNSIAFRVYIADKKQPDVPIPGLKYTIEYQLTSSREKGICMNYPAFEEADEKPDLIFDSTLFKHPPENQSFYSNELIKSKEDEGQNYFATITSYDYGSFGSLKTKVFINVNGKKLPPVFAHFKDDKADTVSIPYDKNQNQIADEWEKQMGILDKDLSGHGDSDDFPKDLNEDYLGDGLSNYEEYRGFSENHKHIRTDPTKRDVMICDQIKKNTEKGIGMFQIATGLVVHSKFAKEEFGKKTPGGLPGEAAKATEFGISPVEYDRTVNFNNDKRFNLTDQHGILMMASKESLGAAEAVAKSGVLIGTPKDYYFLVITADFDPAQWQTLKGTMDDKGNVTVDPNAKSNIFIDEYSVAIAHEMLHCVNVLHHGDIDPGKVIWSVSEDKKHILESSLDEKGNKTGTLTIYPIWDDAQGTPVSTSDEIWKNGPIKLYVGGIHGQHSGYENCLMRYDCADAYTTNAGTRCLLLKVKASGGTHMVHSDEFKYEVTGTGLCTSSEGTGVNASDHQPRDRYGNADKGRGNCKNQIKISDQ